MISTTDVNGVQLARGDYVVPSDAMILDNPSMFSTTDMGQIEHIVHDGARSGIHVQCPLGNYIANNGRALRKVR